MGGASLVRGGGLKTEANGTLTSHLAPRLQQSASWVKLTPVGSVRFSKLVSAVPARARAPTSEGALIFASERLFFSLAYHLAN